jgi:hypothetical protein
MMAAAVDHYRRIHAALMPGAEIGVVRSVASTGP